MPPGQATGLFHATHTESALNGTSIDIWQEHHDSANYSHGARTASDAPPQGQNLPIRSACLAHSWRPSNTAATACTCYSIGGRRIVVFQPRREGGIAGLPAMGRGRDADPPPPPGGPPHDNGGNTQGVLGVLCRVPCVSEQPLHVAWEWHWWLQSSPYHPALQLFTSQWPPPLKPQRHVPPPSPVLHLHRSQFPP